MSKILLIEDDLSVASMYKDMFADAGFETHIANDGLAGIDFANSINPQVILLDIMMPKLDGLETLKRLKASESTKNIPVIMLTNAGVDVMRNEAMSIGADRFIVKTEYDNDTLIEIIKSYLKE